MRGAGLCGERCNVPRWGAALYGAGGFGKGKWTFFCKVKWTLSR